MKERPILFSASMVRAILDGRKTQTRRICKPQPYSNGFHFDGRDIVCHIDDLPPSAMLMDVGRGKNRYTTSNLEGWEAHCPYGQPGDRLWVRETWAQNWHQHSDTRMDRSFVYRADGEACAQDNGTDLPWRPSIHMPRWASRITLEVTGVRVERLQEISEADAIAEGWPKQGDPGAETGGNGGPFDWYRALWGQINGAGSWEARPWVWVVSFRRIEQEAAR